MPDSPYVIHLISNTHWDREWLFNFQETRLMLVDFFDGLLDILDKHPEYRSFVLDAQVVPIEDYLEARPENRERIIQAVSTGRLLIGPWYTCPEGFQVNGESLVRNLLYGHRVARSYGGVMKVGHTPFSYGQNSQMPQIYQGFGIDTMLFYHGVSHDEVKNEWIFEGADGTRVLGSQMSSGARYNFYHHVYRSVLYGMTINDREWTWEKGGLPFHLSRPERAMDHHFLLDAPRGFDRDALAAQAAWLREREIEVSTTRHLAFMMGHDSSVADAAEIDMIAEMQRLFPEDEVKHGHYPELIAAIRAEVDWERLTVLKGERRVPKPMPVTMHLYSDVLSSRIRVKQANAQAEFLLQRRAEPFAVLAALAGMEYPGAMLDLAWKTLLPCHAHDSISGSGVDDIEADMNYRLRQVTNLANALMKRALGQLQLNISNADASPDAVLITVFNASPQTRTEVVTAAIDLPYTGPKGEFALVDASSGTRVRVQDAERRPHWAVVNHAGDAPHMMKTQRFRVHIEARDIPAMGYATFLVDRSGRFDRGSLVPAANTLENEYLRVCINPDGTLYLMDKITGVSYDDLGYFLDNGEAGHAWMHHNPARDQVIDSRGFPVAIALEEDGPLLARFRIECRMQIPARLEENGGDPWQRLDGIGNAASRSEETRELRLVTHVTFHRDSRSVLFSVLFDNPAEDHRLRVLFPTRRPGVTAHAESAFDVVERETVFSEDSPWHGMRGVTFPMQRFVDVSGSGAGLAIINDGLREYEVSPDEDRAIAVTLMRAYQVNLTTVSCRWDTHPEMKLSQCPGEHTFHFRIYPHAGDYAEGSVLEEAEKHVVPLEIAQAGAHSGTLPRKQSFLSVEPANLVLSALKRAENGEGWVIRLYNPSPETIMGKIQFAQTPESAVRLSLEEIQEEALLVTGNTVSIEAGPKKIFTLRVVF